MTPISQESRDGNQLSELEARLTYAGEVQHALAEAERAFVMPGRERPEPHIIRALTLLANRHERELNNEHNAEHGDL